MGETVFNAIGGATGGAVGAGAARKAYDIGKNVVGSNKTPGITKDMMELARLEFTTFAKSKGWDKLLKSGELKPLQYTNQFNKWFKTDFLRKTREAFGNKATPGMPITEVMNENLKDKIFE